MKTRMNRLPERLLKIFLGVLLLSLALLGLSLIGRNLIGFGVFREGLDHLSQGTPLSSEGMIYWGERFPRTWLAMLAGSGLALSGLVIQAIFRNPLATPYTLGIASGASLGAVLGLQTHSLVFSPEIWGYFWKIGFSPIFFFSFTGAFLTMLLIYLLARNEQNAKERMLLAGIAINFFFSSLILCIQLLSDPTRTFQILRWTTGGIELCETTVLIILTGVTLAAFFFILLSTRELDLLLLGDERAETLGMNTARFHRKMFLLTSVLIGTLVAICGPIAFVGLMVPHACRLVLGQEHHRLVPWTFFAGALFLALCHTFSRTVIYPSQLPVGVLTSLLGGPFFLFLLLTRSCRF